MSVLVAALATRRAGVLAEEAPSRRPGPRAARLPGEAPPVLAAAVATAACPQRTMTRWWPSCGSPTSWTSCGSGTRPWPPTRPCATVCTPSVPRAPQPWGASRTTSTSPSCSGGCGGEMGQSTLAAHAQPACGVLRGKLFLCWDAKNVMSSCGSFWFSLRTLWKTGV